LEELLLEELLLEELLLEESLEGDGGRLDELIYKQL
jgi:hypothetical protein